MEGFSFFADMLRLVFQDGSEGVLRVGKRQSPKIRHFFKRARRLDIIGDEVVVAFRGMCANCKMAELTLRDVVQAKLQEYVSESITVTEQK